MTNSKILHFPPGKTHSTVHRVSEPKPPTRPVSPTPMECAELLKRIGERIFLRNGASSTAEADQIIRAAMILSEALARRRW